MTRLRPTFRRPTQRRLAGAAALLGSYLASSWWAWLLYKPYGVGWLWFTVIAFVQFPCWAAGVLGWEMRTQIRRDPPAPTAAAAPPAPTAHQEAS